MPYVSLFGPYQDIKGPQGGQCDIPGSSRLFLVLATPDERWTKIIILPAATARCSIQSFGASGIVVARQKGASDGADARREDGDGV